MPSEVALFRAQVIGALARRELTRGEFATEIRKLAKARYNGPTYVGDALRLACETSVSERLGITLIHARPYDAPAACRSRVRRRGR